MRRNNICVGGWGGWMDGWMDIKVEWNDCWLWMEVKGGMVVL
jgi:hypothetical protein